MPTNKAAAASDEMFFHQRILDWKGYQSAYAATEQSQDLQIEHFENPGF